MDHAKLSPSAAARWLSCSAAIAQESKAPPEKPSPYAAEGTTAHMIAEKVLKNDYKLDFFLGKTFQTDGFDFTVGQDMIDAVQIYVEYIENLNAVQTFAEVKVDLSPWVPEGKGTADCVVEAKDALYVVDLKYGKGVRVEAFENPQGMLYALGAIHTLEPVLDKPVDKVVIAIVQPRIDHISEYEISVKELLQWGEGHVKPLAKEAYALLKTPDNIPAHAFNPSEKACRWCKAKADCKAAAQVGYEAAVEGFAVLSDDDKNDVMESWLKKENLSDVTKLSNVGLASAWHNMKLFTAWAAGLEAELEKRLMDGQNVPGLKPVQTQANRTWKLEEEKTVKFLRTAGLQKKDYQVIKLVSPTQAEKLLKKLKPKDWSKRYQKLETAAVHRPEGKIKVVPEDDKRPSVVPGTDGFNDIDDDFLN